MPHPPAFFTVDAPDVAAFAAAIDAAHAAWPGTPRAASVEAGVPIYDGTTLVVDTGLLDEWAAVFDQGPGVMVIRAMFPDIATVDAATEVFDAIIAEQRAGSHTEADHFGEAGANDRIWNTQQKLCLQAPEVFALYYANPLLDLVCRAWLGANYQMTAQVNLVNPGGAAQQAHRDYHLGFQTNEQAVAYPVAAHAWTARLTLQGGCAHTDMPVETGPTQTLPFSQICGPGYLAYRDQAFQEYFTAHRAQLPLTKGDGIFFNPAVFHAAGANRTTDVPRMANLMQVSSAFGRAMETLDRTAMSKALLPALRTLAADGRLTQQTAQYAIASCAEGYAFPTNLDTDPPVGGLAPKSQQEIMAQALAENWDDPRFATALDDLTTRQRP